MIYIIGAGPVGSYAAYILAKAGHKVNVYEKKASTSLGTPVQCTGLLTDDLERFSLVSPKNKESSRFIVNTLSSGVVECAGSKINIPMKEYLVDRQKFDRYIAEQAQAAGARFFFSHEFKGYDKKDNKIMFKDSSAKKDAIKASIKNIILKKGDVLIGADGPLSVTEEAFFPKNRKEYFLALQARIRISTDGKSYQTFFDKNLSPDFFAWLVPEDKTISRIAIATRGNPKIYFKNFLSFLEKKYKLKNINRRIIEKQGGLIPLYVPANRPQRRLKSGARVFLLGDAASQTKATTLGGIIPGFTAAELLARKLSGKQANFLGFRLGLRLHLMILKAVNRLSKEEFKELLDTVNDRKIKKILKETSRDNPIRLSLKLALAKPSLIKYAGKLIL